MAYYLSNSISRKNVENPSPLQYFEGIVRLVSNDGLNFACEIYMCIAAPANRNLNNPQPICLSNASYMMLYGSYVPEMMDKPKP